MMASPGVRDVPKNTPPRHSRLGFPEERMLCAAVCASQAPRAHEQQVGDKQNSNSVRASDNATVVTVTVAVTGSRQACFSRPTRVPT